MLVFLVNKEMKMKTINELDKIEHLIPLPPVIDKIEQLFFYPEINLSDLSELISVDPALALAVLNFANSLHSEIKAIDTIDKACIFLGIRNLKETLLPCIPDSRIRNYSSYEGMIWQHAIASALLSASIAERIDKKLKNTAYTAGLVHDFGKMILAQYFPKYFHKIVNKMEKEKISFIESEKAVIEITHTEIGEKLAHLWGLPANLTEVIAHHHNPSLAKYNPKLVSIVRFADSICAKLKIGFDCDEDAATQNIFLIKDKGMEESVVFYMKHILDNYEILGGYY